MAVLRDDNPISPEQPIGLPINIVPTFPNQNYFIGDANFTSFVSLGNSIVEIKK